MPRLRRSGFGVKPPQRQISNASLDAEIDGLVTVVGLVKGLYTVGLATVTGALTIVRTRGVFSVRAAAAAVGNSITRGAFGIILVSTDAFAAGVGSVPGPISDDFNDWYVWAPFTLLHDDTTPSDSPHVTTVQFDSRGMRKSKFGQVAVAVLEVESDLAGTALDSAFSMRNQVKL